MQHFKRPEGENQFIFGKNSLFRENRSCTEK